MSEHEEERLARVALNGLAEPGDPRYAALVAEIGARRLHDYLLAECDLQGTATDAASRLSDVDPVRRLEVAHRQGIRFVIPGDREWPVQLDELHGLPALQERGGVPLGLWVRGPLRIDTLSGSVAVVGSRSSTTYGEQVARDLAGGLATSAVPVISGAAFGIDAAAHRAAVNVGGPTVAVLACGVDVSYPKTHAALIDHLAQHGALVSEAPPGSAAMRIRFLARNRIIAGLARATVVVEAAVRSGALNTANWSNRLSRPVLGVPGPLTSASSGGVHELIRNGGATLVTSAQDVLEVIGTAGEHLLDVPREPARPRDGLSSRQRQVLDAVPVARGAHVDSICRVAGLGVLEVRSALTVLVSTGMVEQHATGWRLTALAR